MALCPLCGVEASLAHVEIERVNIELLTRDHPDWRREDGSCPPCIDYYQRLTEHDVGAVDASPEEVAEEQASAPELGLAPCPLCNVLAPRAHVEIESLNIELLARDHPDWKREDGSCPACLSYYEDLTDEGVGVEDNS